MHRSIDPQGSLWGNTEELLASLIEVTDLSNRNFFAVYSKKGSQVPPPIHVPRPGESPDTDTPERKRPPRRQSTPSDIKRTFGAALRVVPKEPDGA